MVDARDVSSKLTTTSRNVCTSTLVGLLPDLITQNGGLASSHEDFHSNHWPLHLLVLASIFVQFRTERRGGSTFARAFWHWTWTLFRQSYLICPGPDGARNDNIYLRIHCRIEEGDIVNDVEGKSSQEPQCTTLANDTTPSAEECPTDTVFGWVLLLK